jgi:hypothetical protein
MLSKPQLETMALRWAKAYRPGLLPELNQQGPKAAQQWSAQKASQVLEDLQQASSILEGPNLPAEEMQTRLRSLSEQVLADHFPATTEVQDQVLPPRIRRQVDATKAKLLSEQQAKGLTEDEALEVWEYLRQSLTEGLLEQEDAERVDAAVTSAPNRTT